jgi:hypothetical protein
MDERVRDAEYARLGRARNNGNTVIKTAQTRLRDEDLAFESIKNKQHFQGTAFPCILAPTSVKFNKSGALEVMFVLPPEERNQVIPLGFAMREPLYVAVLPWRNLDLIESE